MITRLLIVLLLSVLESSSVHPSVLVSPFLLFVSLVGYTSLFMEVVLLFVAKSALLFAERRTVGYHVWENPFYRIVRHQDLARINKVCVLY